VLDIKILKHGMYFELDVKGTPKEDQAAA